MPSQMIKDVAKCGTHQMNLGNRTIREILLSPGSDELLADMILYLVRNADATDEQVIEHMKELMTTSIR